SSTPTRTLLLLADALLDFAHGDVATAAFQASEGLRGDVGQLARASRLRSLLLLLRFRLPLLWGRRRRGNSMSGEGKPRSGTRRLPAFASLPTCAGGSATATLTGWGRRPRSASEVAHRRASNAWSRRLGRDRRSDGRRWTRRGCRCRSRTWRCLLRGTRRR